MRKNKRGLLVAALLIGLLVVTSGTGSNLGFFFRFIRGLATAGILLTGGLVALIIYLTKQDNKKKGQNLGSNKQDPIDTTYREIPNPASGTPHPAQSTASAQGRGFSEPPFTGASFSGSPRTAVEKLFYPYRTSPGLGSIVHTALQQSRRHEEQERKYTELVARRFGTGTMTYTKYMTLQADATDAMFRVYQKIANRMVAFNDKEYQHLITSMYKYDSIPDDIQEARLALYQDNLKEMKDSLRENEQTMYAIDQLLLELADANYSESGIQEQIETLTKQLDYYKQAL
ncbi:MAG: hypothetical protein Q4B22_02380 [Eubacteriales bacterium]|nr:hypothetical protein [Eubacteriales bacterium]